MRGKIIWTITFVMLSMAPALRVAQAQDAKTPYPQMAPLEQYLMESSAEIALARSAAPKSISDGAEVMVLDRDGYKVAVKGTNGFVCVVERGWDAGKDDPNFWNPKLRGPDCFNAAAARTFWPIMMMRTRLILGGKTKEQAIQATQAALDSRELPPLETGAMCFMLSKDQYLNDEGHHWHPHLMFFVPMADAAAWGADVHGSPIIAGPDPDDRLTIFLVPVGHWSDGTEAHAFEQ